MRDGQSSRGSKLFLEQLEDRVVLDATSFVTALYSDLLDRAPDPAGLAGWVGAIQNGQSNQQVATAIWRSAEHRGLEVDSYYESFLNRPADPAGRAGWVNAMVTGALNEQGVETAILTSAEFTSKFSTPAAYVSGLYLDILDRPPGPTEQTFWVNALARSGNTFVVTSILTSSESYTRIVTSDYQNYLLRQPESAGLQGWLNALLAGSATVESFAEGILGSGEYAQLHAQPPTGLLGGSESNAVFFVTAVYQDLLGRAPDTNGLNGWVAAIENGASNQDVATGIWRSAEHRTIQVTGYYETFLNRAPDAGLNGWVTALLNGSLNEQGVELGFLTSSEYLRNHPTSATYINGLYLDILDRPPGPTEQIFWQNALAQSGTLFVAASILTSSESYVRTITADYVAYLHRQPDPAGLQSWLNGLISGPTTVESLAEGIIGSAEYANLHAATAPTLLLGAPSGAVSFVTALYQQLLNRNPDPAGLAGWVAAIKNGTTNQQVATAIWRSTEHRIIQVTAYYQTYLNRKPDAAGLAGLVNSLQNGTLNEQGVQLALVTSGEFVRNNPTPSSYVNALYLDMLGRAPGPLESPFWQNALATSGPFFVAASILTSSESYARLINGYYMTYLGRPADPAGLEGWLNALLFGNATVESVAENILGSAEYANLH